MVFSGRFENVCRSESSFISVKLHAFVYALPIVVRFPKRPVFCFWSTLAIFTSFKVGDYYLQVDISLTHLHGFHVVVSVGRGFGPAMGVDSNVLHCSARNGVEVFASTCSICRSCVSWKCDNAYMVGSMYVPARSCFLLNKYVPCRMYSYAGNANFVYAGTLILSVAQVICETSD